MIGACSAGIESAQLEIDRICYRIYDISAEDRLALESELGTDVKGLPTPASPKDCAAALVSWLVGVVFGRFDVRLATGERPIPDLPGPFDPLPIYSPGTLPDGQIPDAYPLRIDQDGILANDEHHEDAVVLRIREVLHLIWNADADGIENELCQMLGVKTLRDYLAKPSKGGFWEDHVRRYSKSRRKAPIYWLFQSPRGLYQVWIYYHRLDRDTLPKLLGPRYLAGKIDEVRSAMAELRPSGETKKGITKKEEKRLAELDELLTDLEAMAQIVRDATTAKDERGHAVGYAPDLDDGVVLCAAPIWRLVPWPRTVKLGQRRISELQAYWEQLVAGKYDWSHGAMHYWPDRVTAKCRSDKSLALAHGLDEEFFPGLRESLRKQSDTASDEPAGDQDEKVGEDTEEEDDEDDEG